MKKIALWLLVLCGSPIFAQTDSGDLQNYLNAKISAMPGDTGDDYVIPSAGELTTWEECITAIIADDLTTARSKADQLNYQIVTYTDTGGVGKTVNILEEKSPQMNYWGTYAFDDQLVANVVIQAPHAIFDFNTGKQAVYCFRKLQTGFLFLNGTHRCNHDQASTCSGTTSVCGMSQAFRVSDLAHNTTSMYQKTTEVVYDMINDAMFVQLHGFTKLPDDPYVILSNGSDQTPAGADNVVAFKDQLFLQDNTLTFKIAHVDNWTRLVGFTNTQGRYINQSTNPCNSSATMTSDRFIHVEQEKTKLRDDQTGWEKIFQTIGNLYGGIASVEEYINLKFKSENPFKESIEFAADGVTRVGLYSLTGLELYTSENTSHLSDFAIPTSNLPGGIYILKVMTNQGTAAKKLIRE